MKFTLFFSLFLILLSCNGLEDNVSFKEIQKQNMRRFTMDKSLFNLKGKVKVLIIPIKLNDDQQNKSKKTSNSNLVNEIFNKYNLIDFEYFEFDVYGNVTKMFYDPFEKRSMEEYIYKKGLLYEVKESTFSGEIFKTNSFNYNKEGLLSQVKTLNLIEGALVETSKVEIFYTNNFISYRIISLDIEGKNDTLFMKLDKKNNRIEQSPMINYKYNKDSLVTTINYIKSKDKTSFFYDSFGNKVREIHYDSLKQPFLTKSYYYNFKNQLIESINQDSSELEIIIFNENNQIKDHYSQYLDESNLNYHSQWENYDKLNNIIHSSVIRMSENRRLEERLLNYTYEFDKHNNWIKKKIYRNDSFIRENSRIIEYY